MYYEEDYYEYQPSDADEIISDATDQLVSLIKQRAKRNIVEVIEENKRITDENKKLRDEAYEVKKLKTEYENKLKSLESEFYRSKLKDVIEKANLTSEIWRIETKSERQEKCDKCDKNGNITVIDEFGREHKVSCICRSNIVSYYTYPINLCNVSLYKRERDEINMYGKYYDEKREIGITFSKSENYVILDTLDTSITPYRCYYRTKEEAQKHCDYLNEKI